MIAYHELLGISPEQALAEWLHDLSIMGYADDSATERELLPALIAEELPWPLPTGHVWDLPFDVIELLAGRDGMDKWAWFFGSSAWKRLKAAVAETN